MKDALPIIWGEFGVRALARSNDVAIPGRRTRLTAQHFLKPLVLAAGVVRHDVHQYPHATGVDFLDQEVDIVQGAKSRIDLHVIRNVVPAILQRRGIER